MYISDANTFIKFPFKKTKETKNILSIPTVTGYWHSLITCMS
jgi:hypothetical protein